MSEPAKKDLHLQRRFHVRAIELTNRLVLAPMQMYTGVNGFPVDWHTQHLAKYAIGGFGTVFTEALAVQEVGRNTHGDLGIWNDEFIEPLARIADTLRGLGVVPATQIFHAGPKASRQRPWEGYGALGESDAGRGYHPWQPVAPSPDPRVEGWHAPRELTLAEIHTVIDDYGKAAKRCAQAGFDVLEVHGAHGYLIHSFYSPLGNDRTDEYGGPLERRMRFPLEVAEAVRGNWPEDKPFFYRLSCVDDGENGWRLDDTVVLARELKARGVDLIDCSSRGIGLSPTARVISRIPGFQVPFADRVRSEVAIPTMAVGLIRKATEAEDILRKEQADLVCIAREALYNPHWALHAIHELGGDPEFERWTPQYGWWLNRREQQLELGQADIREGRVPDLEQLWS